MPLKTITPSELIELKMWLEKLDINCSKLHRDFSDCVLMAHLIKKLYPKLVDMHNFPPRNNTQLKQENWDMFNSKVLVKLGISQNKSMLEKFAKSVPGAIDFLLMALMQHEKAAQAERNKKIVIEEETKKDDLKLDEEIMVITVNRKEGESIVQVEQKMILFSMYENTVHNLQLKEDLLTIAQQKIEYLEDLLHKRDKRTAELARQLHELADYYVNDCEYHVLPKELPATQPETRVLAQFSALPDDDREEIHIQTGEKGDTNESISISRRIFN